ncbi:MAG: ABC transporter permease [Simkaniaceae bacterium]|nr:ABC transporter permease [Simkaniaceae bacterium]
MMIAVLTYLFLYLPIVILIIFSFNTATFPAPLEGFTLKWYRELFSTPDLWHAFFNSLKVAVSSTMLSLTMGTLLIYLQLRGGRISKFIPLFYGNLVIPESILAVSLIGFFALFHIPLGLTTLIVAHTILGLGFVVPILYLRYREIDPRLAEVSYVLGASPTKTFFKIILPMLKPALIASGLLVFVISFDDFILSYFCSGTCFETLSLYLVSSIRFGISPVVNALAAILLILTSLLTVLFFSSKRKVRVF